MDIPFCVVLFGFFCVLTADLMSLASWTAMINLLHVYGMVFRSIKITIFKEINMQKTLNFVKILL